MGCIGTNNPDLEPDFGFEQQVFEDAAMIIFWSANDAFTNGDKIHDAPKENDKHCTTVLICNL